jgi:hypothetical protein
MEKEDVGVIEGSRVTISEVAEGFKEGKDLAQLLVGKTSLPELRLHPKLSRRKN